MAKTRSTKKRKVTADDLYAIELIAECRMAPDGASVVYTQQWVEKDTEKKHQNLWLASSSGRPAPRRFTWGKQTDRHPRFAPDGKSIAFLSRRAGDDYAQIYRIPIDGGEALPVTQLEGTIGGFRWSPDGKAFVITFRAVDAEERARKKDPKKKELGVVERHITRTFFKFDGEGFTPKERWQIHVINAKTGKATALTEGERDRGFPAWSPDSKHIVYVENSRKEPDLEPDYDDLYVIPVKGGKPRRVRTPNGNKTHPTFTPNGASLVYYGQRGMGDWWRNNEVWIVALEGGGAKSLTEGFDLNCSTATINDMLGLPAVQPPLFVDEGTRALVPAAEHGSTVIKSISLDPKRRDVQEVIGGPGVVGSISYPTDGSRFAFTRTTMSDPGQVFVRDADGGEERALTRINRWLDRVDLGAVEELWFKGGAKNDLQGWVITPPGFKPKKTYPSILQIHGGPLTQYGFAFMHEFYLLAAAGYVVYFSNPRGGLGYGEAHAGSIFENGWGTDDYDDLMAFTNRIARRSYIDKQRMGVTGGSYGGYMTCWIVGHTDRFEAAVTQRCVSNLISMNGSSDFNWVFERVMGGARPWDDVERYWDRSPMKYVGNVTTPTLVIHSEQDLRCAIEQGEQFYVALKRLGVPSELVRFPDEPHGLSRGGRTDRRVKRLQHIVRWFDRYLKGRRRARTKKPPLRDVPD